MGSGGISSEKLEQIKLRDCNRIQYKTKRFNIDDLRKELNEKVLGQRVAVETILDAVTIWDGGLKNHFKPVGAFLFVGSTGTGKTELARSLQQALYKNSDFLQLDMSNFTWEHSISSLIGSARGLIGSDKDPLFVSELKKNPRRVVIIDELEKAHRDVHKVFLAVFDTGILQDASNTRIDCTETIFIMTSNLAVEKIASSLKEGVGSRDLLKIIEPDLIKEFSPEFYARIQTVVFNPIKKEDKAGIVKMKLDQCIDCIDKETEIKIEYDTSILKYFCEIWEEGDGVRSIDKELDKIKISFLKFTQKELNVDTRISKLSILREDESFSFKIVSPSV